MSWLTDLFSSGVNAVIGTIGGVIDELTTTDEEKLKIKNVLVKEMNNFKKFQLDSIATYDKEITTRHKTDMNSDSWLSKNIRPVLLIFLTGTMALLAYSTIFILTPDDLKLIEPWIDLYKVLLMTGYMFYFGSRGYEKVQKIKSDKQNGGTNA